MQLYDRVFGQYDRVCVLFLCPSRPVVARDGAYTRFVIFVVVARARFGVLWRAHVHLHAWVRRFQGALSLMTITGMVCLVLLQSITVRF